MGQQQTEQPVAYRLPTYEALSWLGFRQWAAEASILPTSRVGCAGGTIGIWQYPGYKGSQALEIILNVGSSGQFTLGPPGPNKQRNPLFGAKDKEDFLRILYAAGYPTREQKIELDKADELAQLEQWEKETAFIELTNKGRKIKKALPPRPKLKYY